MAQDLERENNLLPIRHPQKEFFVCDLNDIPLKDDMVTMEHPFFSLSKIPDQKIRKYHNAGVDFEITPSVMGHPTIWDKDILLFAISSLIAERNAGREISPKVEFNAKDFLIFANRSTSGYDYERLRKSLVRLQGSTIVTDAKTGGEEETESFQLISKFKVKRKTDKGRVLAWSVTLSDWIFRALESAEVLTLDFDYFRLKTPTERRIYEIARKFCGQKQKFKIGLKKLHIRTGSTSSLRRFRFEIKRIAETRTMPDYDIAIEDDWITFLAKTRSKVVARPKSVPSYERPDPSHLKDTTWEQASKIASQAGLDKYAIFGQFADRVARDGQPQSLDGAFLAYLRKATNNHSDQRGFNF